MRPTLVVNPATDRVFKKFAHLLLDHGATSIEALERKLRTLYPTATVHARELAAEPTLVWYLYRDGHWIDTRPGHDDPAEPTSESFESPPA